MAAVTQRVDNYLGGVSRQSDDKKIPGQVRECINAYPDPTFGLTKRPGFQWITNLGTGTTYDLSKWFYIHRDNDEKYIGCIKPAPDGGTGDIDIWNTTSGTPCTIHYDALPWEANKAYVVGDKVTNDSNKIYQCDVAGTSAGSGGPTGTGSNIADNSARWDYVSGAQAQAYLTGARTNYDILTVQDTSIITSNKIVANKIADPAFVDKSRATLIISDIVVSTTFSVTIDPGGGVSPSTATVNSDSDDTYDDVLLKIKNAIVALSISGITDSDVNVYAASVEIQRKVSGTFTAFGISCKGGAANNKLDVFQDQVDNISQLPMQSFHNRIVKIINTNSVNDTYYAQFIADNEISGRGYWEETLAPGTSIGLDASTMPHELINTSKDVFVFKRIDWTARSVGDDITNSHPSFIGKKIEQAFFHSNRLGFLSQDNVSMSQSGDFYNFYHSSALTLTAADPVDLNCSSIKPALLHGVIPTGQGLVLFSKNQQFLMSGSDGVLTPTSTTISTISNYEMDTNVDPVDMGTNINFISKTPSFTRIFGMITRGQNENPQVLDIGKVVNEWVPPNIDTFVASPHNQFLAMSGQDSNKVYFYRTYGDGDQILIQAWFNWELPGTVQNITVDQDAMFAVTKNGTQFTLSKASLSQSPDDAIIINHRGDKVNPCVDLYATASSVTFNTIDKLNIISPGAKYDSAPTVTIGKEWATDTAYKIGDQVIASNRVYTATTTATSTGSTVPSHTTGTESVGGVGWAYAGIQATATAEVSGGANDKTVTALKITNPGSGYTRTDIPGFVTISPAPSSNAGNATATASATKYNGSRCFLPYNNISTLTPIMVIKGTTQTGTFTESGFTITPDVVIDKGDVHFTVPYKDLTSSASDVVVGWKYNLDVTLPRTYVKSDGTKSDFTASLIIKRMKFAVGLSGVMGFKLKTTGRLEGSRTYTADGKTTAYSWLKSDLSYVYKNEIKVKINNALTSNFTVTGDTQITLDSASSQSKTLSGDGSKVFDLTFTPTNPSLIKVEIGGVEQASNTYHLVKNYIHFDSAPATASNNIFVYSADTILIYTDEWHNLNPIQEAGTYLANDVPLDDLSVFTIPIHQKSENFVLRIVNDSPFPVSLNSMMWEGNYTPRFYRRI